MCVNESSHAEHGVPNVFWPAVCMHWYFIVPMQQGGGKVSIAGETVVG